jgi:hypothetical protein
LPDAVLNFLRLEAKAWGMKLSYRMVTDGTAPIVARLRDGRLGVPRHHNPGMALEGPVGPGPVDQDHQAVAKPDQEKHVDK